MKCLKTGFNVSINNVSYRADLYSTNAAGTIYGVKVNPQSKNSLLISDCDAWFYSEEGLAEHESGYPILLSYKFCEFDKNFAAEVARINNGLVLVNFY